MIQTLVVDDHNAVRRQITTLVNGILGCEVCGDASNGQEAFEQVAKLKPDLVLLDVSMPGTGGIMTAKMIRQIAPNMTIILLSIHDPVQVAHQATSKGVRIDAYLNKSYASQNLKSVLVSLGLLPKE
jgi:DNA-binding NarL/FixJ family response regulator